jgi:hypothetical protein
MIQRIQSLYLTSIIILSLLLLNGSILTFAGESGNTIRLSAAGTLSEEGPKLVAHVAPAWSFISLLTAICLISVAALFMFRKRRMQMLLTISVIVLSALLTAAFVWLGFSVSHDFKMTFSPGIKMTFPVFILVFSILAFRGIQKDDRMVKSYDRLR